MKVLFGPLSNIDGLTAQVSREGVTDAHVIVVNEEHDDERQRFTIAHEIGHMVLDISAGVDEEKAAHRFAGAFLMPEEAIRAEVGKRRSAISLAELFELKMIFRASVQAITYRCKDLGIISPALMGRMFNAFRELGWRSPPYEEPLAMSGERSGRFERLCFRALSEGAISESRASELLEMSVYDLNRQMVDPSFPDAGVSGEGIGAEMKIG